MHDAPRARPHPDRLEVPPGCVWRRLHPLQRDKTWLALSTCDWISSRLGLLCVSLSASPPRLARRRGAARLPHRCAWPDLSTVTVPSPSGSWEPVSA